MIERKENKLFVFLGFFFITNALVAEFIGVKIFSLEKLLGFSSQSFSLFGVDFEGINLSAGVLQWPIVFIMTDIINEYYGKRGVRLLSFLTAGMILYAFIFVKLAIEVPPAPFWDEHSWQGVKVPLNPAFHILFGQGLWIIAGSITAFLIGQLVDVISFHLIRRKTGSKLLWLRATGSTLISQFIDSYVVLFIAFYFGWGWDLNRILAVGIVNYTYKGLAAILLTPLLYLFHFIIDTYLGKDLSQKLQERAANEPPIEGLFDF